MRSQNPEFFKSDIDVHKVKRIDFGVLNPNEITKMSVVEIDNRYVYDNNGNPNRGGIIKI